MRALWPRVIAFLSTKDSFPFSLSALNCLLVYRLFMLMLEPCRSLNTALLSVKSLDLIRFLGYFLIFQLKVVANDASIELMAHLPTVLVL